ncbi:similar to Saccharomyces cerevisiae YHL034C SBP1 Putative RNA binding protein [Maudiozyma saulgeensis]|uniref:Similar to Saccharomyces cerevisiae YHL034C SBP1 Putative RNA binding protein n=1 Tax=Maudiozyma saulgeensis TaxID=1789683 RepID=A0A1X7R464_9SACH|nr:similar to Saccharomyces cerevisiae YHL034C SBP1 Putative RNA binding protein [Kazachstania saulgeensis]
MSGETETIEIVAQETPIVEKPALDPETTVFIGNVALDATVEDLEKLFKDDYESVEVDIPEKEHKGAHVPLSKHAFVKFPVTIDFDDIKTKFDLAVINDRAIHIKRVRSPDELRGANRGRFGRGSFRGRGRGRGSFRGRGRGGFSRGPKIPLSEMERSTDTIYINNVPFETTKTELAEFFGTNEDSVVLPMRRLRDEVTRRSVPSDKYNRGMAFIKFDNLSGSIADKAGEFDGKSLGDRTLVVDVAVVKPALPEQAEDEETAVDSENKESA